MKSEHLFLHGHCNFVTGMSDVCCVSQREGKRAEKAWNLKEKYFPRVGKNANKTRQRMDSRRQLKLVGCTMSHIISKLCGVKSSERMEFVIIIVVIIPSHSSALTFSVHRMTKFLVIFIMQDELSPHSLRVVESLLSHGW